MTKIYKLNWERVLCEIYYPSIATNKSLIKINKANIDIYLQCNSINYCKVILIQKHWELTTHSLKSVSGLIELRVNGISDNRVALLSGVLLVNKSLIKFVRA